MTMTIEPQAQAPSKGAGILTNIALSLGIWALLAGLAGLALHRGFGVSVPFIPAFLLSFTFGMTVKVVGMMTAQTWHEARVKADLALMAAMAMTSKTE
jgi:hypothetical protein